MVSPPLLPPSLRALRCFAKGQNHEWGLAEGTYDGTWFEESLGSSTRCGLCLEATPGKPSLKIV